MKTHLIVISLSLFLSSPVYAEAGANESALQKSIDELRTTQGKWDAVTEFLNPDGSVAKSVSGTYQFDWIVPDRILSGQTTVPELDQTSAILFYINDKDKKIEMVSVGSDGKLWVMTGALGGDMRKTQEYATADGGTGQLRFTRYNVQDDTFESKMEYTSDGGETWVMGNHQQFKRAKAIPYNPVSMDTEKPDADFPPTLHELLIPSHEAMLSGIMYGANGPGPHPTALLLHGFPGNEKNLDLAQSLKRAGFNVLFFHYRGAWGSQGEYTIGGQSEDVAAVLDYIRQNADQLRVNTQRLSIIGHSMGGFSALQAAAKSDDLNCVVGLAAFNFEPETEPTKQQSEGIKAYVDQLFMLNELTGDKFFAEAAANEASFDNRNLSKELSGKSLLLITGSEDTSVPPAMQSRLVDAYGGNPDINLTAKIIPGDHSFSVNRIELQHTVIDWMNSNCR